MTGDQYNFVTSLLISVREYEKQLIEQNKRVINLLEQLTNNVVLVDDIEETIDELKKDIKSIKDEQEA